MAPVLVAELQHSLLFYQMKAKEAEIAAFAPQISIT